MKYKGAKKQHAGQTVVKWWITEIRKADKGARKSIGQGFEVGVLSSRGIAWLLQKTSKQANSRLTVSDETLGSLRMYYGDFPDGPVVKNLPANAGDEGLIPNLGKFYMPQAIEPVPCNYWNVHTLEPFAARVALLAATGESLCVAVKHHWK